eukprot:gene20009-biopygen11564
MGRGRIAGAPTPDIWGRKAGRGRRLQAYGYAPALQPQTYRPPKIVGSGRQLSGPEPVARARRGVRNCTAAPHLLPASPPGRVIRPRTHKPVNPLW